MSVGVYQPGNSCFHRATPGLKLAALAIYAVALSVVEQFFKLMGLRALVLVTWQIAGLTWAQLSANLKPLIWILLALFGFQLFVAGFWGAFDTVLTLAALVVAAALVSHTTRTDDMLDTLTATFSPFARFGVKPEDAAFVLVFTVRLVPFVSIVGREAIDARRARGAGRNPVPALVPMVIRLMRETDALSEAVVARGFGRT